MSTPAGLNSDSGTGSVPQAHLLLRSKLRKLHEHVDGLLSRKGKMNSEVAKVEEPEAAEEQQVAQASEAAPIEEVSSTDEDDSEDEEAMADLLVKSLRKHQAELSGAVLDKPEASTEGGLDVAWNPDCGLPVAPKTSHLAVVHHEDAVLVDGLLVPPKNTRKLNKLAKKQIPDTAGAKWFNMSAKTLTPELKKDLQLLKMRNILDPKRHYKKEKPSKTLPKYFQIGTVVEAPGEFYSSRLTRKQRKTSFAEELLGDANVTAYRKRKHAEMVQRRQATGKKFQKNTKRRRKEKH